MDTTQTIEILWDVLLKSENEFGDFKVKNEEFTLQYKRLEREVQWCKERLELAIRAFKVN